MASKTGGGKDPGGSGGEEKEKGAGGNGGGGKQVMYGKNGPLFCKICRALRDHLAVDCPGNKCKRCGSFDHWVSNCKAVKCDWCGQLGHEMSSCPKGADRYLGNKRPVGLDSLQDSGPQAKRSGGQAVVGGRSFAQAARRQTRLPFMSKINSFLSEVQSETLMDPEVVAERRKAFSQRKAVVEKNYNEALAALELKRKNALERIARDERQLELELENENDFKQAIDQLALIQNRVLSGASVVGPSSSSVVSEARTEVEVSATTATSPSNDDVQTHVSSVVENPPTTSTEETAMHGSVPQGVKIEATEVRKDLQTDPAGPPGSSSLNRTLPEVPRAPPMGDSGHLMGSGGEPVEGEPRSRGALPVVVGQTEGQSEEMEFLSEKEGKQMDWSQEEEGG